MSKYYAIEQELLNEFKEAHKNNDIPKMKDFADTLSHFKGKSSYCGNNKLKVLIYFKLPNVYINIVFLM